MNSKLEAIIFDRLATLSRTSGKRFAVLDRNAWGERSLSPFMGNNSVEFTGRLVVGDRPRFDDGKRVRIGFYHPLFNGYASRYGAVEVIPNPSEHNETDYAAIGQGTKTLIAAFNCNVYGAPEGPCENVPCEEGYVGVGPVGSGLGSDSSFVFYDRLTMNHPIGKNEAPARLALRGYQGSRTLPDYADPRGVVFNWSAGVAAFDPSFQACGNQQGAVSTWWQKDCCAWYDSLVELYGEDWYTHIDPTQGGEIPWTDSILFSECGFLLQWAAFLNGNG